MRNEVDRLNIEILDGQATRSLRDDTSPPPAEEASRAGPVGTPVHELGRPPRIEVDVQRSRNTRQQGFDYDDETQLVSVRVRITNKELKDALTDMTQHVYAVARHTVEGDRFRLIIKEQDAVYLAIGSTYDYTTKSVRLAYDDNLYAQYVFKYYGWMVLVKDTNGNLVLSKTSKNRLLEHADLLEATAEGKEITM